MRSSAETSESCIFEPQPGLFSLKEDWVYDSTLANAGVYSTQRIKSGTLIETAHCILISRLEYEQHLCHTILEHYVFNGRDGRKLLALGIGSLFNHSSNPNVDYRIDQDRQLILFSAARDIAPEEELCIFYGRVWFKEIVCEVIEGKSHDHLDDEVQFLASMNL